MARHSHRVPHLITAAVTLAAVLLAPSLAEACPICFRESESPMTAGVMAGVGTLLSITAGVLTGFGVLVRRIIRAERGDAA